MNAHRETNTDITLSRSLSQRRARVVLWLIQTCAAALFFLSVGLLYSIYVFGLRALDPRNISTLPQDTSQAYMGWLFFRHEEHLTLPLGWASALGYPRGEPIAYLDSLPGVATLLWPFRHWLPEPFQYLTPWWVLCAALSFYFGSRISRRLCGDDWLTGLVGGLLFMTAPIFVARALQTFALSSHWLILAALEFFLSCSVRLSWRHVAVGVAIAAVAGGINPYISLMSLMLISAGYLRSMLTKSVGAQMPLRARLPIAAVGMGGAIVATLFSWVLFGFLRLDDSAGYAGVGYGIGPMNLLSPINPLQYPALLLKSQTGLRMQGEGYNYFGLGVLFLGLVVLVRKPSAVLAHLTQRDTWPAWLIFVTCTLLALSLKAAAGSFVIYDLQAPAPVMHVLSAFRVSGRLFWPAFYLALAGIISASFMVFGPRTIYALVCAFAVQAADLQGLRNAIHHEWSTAPIAAFTNVPQNLFTNGPVWQELGRRYRHLVVLPPTQCAQFMAPGGEFGFWIFGKLAGEHRMTVNSYYAARSSPKELDYFCRQMPYELSQNGFSEDTAYVFRSATTAYSIPRRGHACRALDDVILCVRASDAPAFGRDASSELLELPLGQAISVSLSNPSGDRLFAPGWWYAEDWGRWTIERETSLSFRAQGTGTLRIDLTVVALATAAHPQNVEIFVNGTHLKDWRFIDGSEGKISLDVAAELIGSDRVVTVKFLLPDTISPKQLGTGDDDRELALGLKGIYLAPE